MCLGAGVVFEELNVVTLQYLLTYKADIGQRPSSYEIKKKERIPYKPAKTVTSCIKCHEVDAFLSSHNFARPPLGINE